MVKSLRRSFNTNNIRIFLPSVLAVVALLLLGGYLSGRFLTVKNLGSILMTASLLMMATTAQNIVLISGNNGIDMSIGAVMSMTALLGPTIPMNTKAEFAVAIVAVMGMGACCGLVNGLGVRLLRIPPLIMTLIMASVVTGFTMFISKGRPAIELSKLLLSVSKPLFPMLRTLTIIGLAIIIIAELVLRKTRIGRTLTVVGDNPRAADLCGVRVGAVTILAYVASSALAGFAGLMLVGYAGSAVMKMADGYTLLSVAAAIIGGTSIAGGKGSLIGGALGAIVLVILNSILQVLRIPEGARFIIQGGLLTIILLANNRSQKLQQ
ncbi:MAG: ABC transporter permease [Planctomycetes bacterium]|nr:ABC transporter permease [Planctomycetota bacterium]